MLKRLLAFFLHREYSEPKPSPARDSAPGENASVAFRPNCMLNLSRNFEYNSLALPPEIEESIAAAFKARHQDKAAPGAETSSSSAKKTD